MKFASLSVKIIFPLDNIENDGRMRRNFHENVEKHYLSS